VIAFFAGIISLETLGVIASAFKPLKSDLISAFSKPALELLNKTFKIPKFLFYEAQLPNLFLINF